MKRKSEGFTFIFGIVVFMFMLIMMLLVIKIAKISEETTKVEDAITSSALASMTIDVQKYAITHEVLLDDIDTSYENLLQVTCDNLRLSRTGTKTKFSGASSLFQSNNDTFTVSKCIFYNVYKNGKVVIYEFGDNGSLKSTTNSTVGSVQTPKGELVEKTGCYVEVDYNVSLMSSLTSSSLIDRPVKKGEYVSLTEY